MKAARALLGLDQKGLAALSGVSVPTIQRMEASDHIVRGIVESLTRVISALDQAGVDLIGENAASAGGGRGIRLKQADIAQPQNAGPQDAGPQDAGPQNVGTNSIGGDHVSN